jgi:hypothetical protein
MNDIDKYLRIMRLIKAGQSNKLNSSDYKFFSKFTFDVDQSSIDKLKKTADFKDLSDEDISKALNDTFLTAAQDPTARENLLNSAEKQENTELANKITNGVNLALSGVDIATSMGQVKAGDRARRALQAPQRPAPLTADPRLSKALSDAGNGKFDAAKALSPAQLQILDQYLSDMNTAKTVSGGQSGVYGALAQTAANRRNRSSAELAPFYDEFTRKGQERYDSLLQQKLNENQNIQQSKASLYPYDLQQYQNQVQAAGELGAAGRQNLRSSLGALGNFAPSIVAQLATRKRFRHIYNQGLAYGPENAKIMADADHAHNNGYQDAHNDPYYQQQYEQIYGINS